jgi:hypothetical protein
MLTGVALCACTQLVYWLQLGTTRPRILFVPFFAAYSQAALLDLIIYDPPVYLRVATWLFAYVVVAVLLWVVLDARRETAPAPWLRIILSWLVVVAAVTVLTLTLLSHGIVQME